ncbi:MAG: glycosyl hydrolase 115 family protein [Bacteroidales bacterium]|nr:glycosyl hydrolase 115 family protein [Bacteroidales bacterium]
MKYLFHILFLLQLSPVIAQFRLVTVEGDEVNSFPVISDNTRSSVYLDSSDYQTVKIAADLLAEDIRMVTGVKPAVISDKTSLPEYMIIIGTIEKCDLIRRLSGLEKIDCKEIDGHWERFIAKTVRDPIPGVKLALIIAGSDRRGAAYGVFELSRAIGISPWYWWADVIPEKKSNLILEPVDYTSKAPSVKYRGIFLNDEDWGLQPWAAKTYEPETADIGPKTYARIFELMLRLKANLIWPAMHNCTRAFYHYPANKEVADAYGIITGSSHAEPMLRNNVDEWDIKTMGDFNYVTNRDAVYRYWEQRAKEGKSYENIYTVGMRGIHDSGMEGVSSMKDKISILKKVIADQREIIQKEINQDLTKVPQAFIPYKEVLEIYDANRNLSSENNRLDLPEDITIIWPDDNYGYIRRLSDPAEQSRQGGAGLYYHLSYWGRPHDYLWLSTTHPMLIWEELNKAYQNKCDRIWVFNTGDIKPCEYNMQLSLDMAFDMESYSDPIYVYKHLNDWLEEIFGKDKTGLLAEIMHEYYSLAFERRPEFMGWSQTEPTRSVRFTEFNHFFFNDEAQRRLNRYNSISHDVSLLKDQIAENRKDAYYELIYYPVRCASLMNRKFLHHEKAYHYVFQHRASANDHAILARQAYDSICAETAYYNESLAAGKWKHMMTMNPRSLPVFDCPMTPEWKVPDRSDWGISTEGYKDERPEQNMYGSRLPVFTPWGDSHHFIDVFLTGTKNISWQAVQSHPWIQLSKSSGNLKNEFLMKEDRVWVSIDWSMVPADQTEKGTITFSGEGKVFVVPVIISRSAAAGDFNGFIESNRYLSLFAANYSRTCHSDDYFWQSVKGPGYSGKVLMLKAMDSDSADDLADNFDYPGIEYDFYSFSEGTAQITVFCLPTHALNTLHQLRISVAVDDSEPQIVDYRTFNRSETWKQNVLRNNAIVKTEHLISSPGKHILKITTLDPGIIIDRITIDFGGLEPAYSAVPETKTNR